MDGDIGVFAPLPLEYLQRIENMTVMCTLNPHKSAHIGAEQTN